MNWTPGEAVRRYETRVILRDEQSASLLLRARISTKQMSSNKLPARLARTTHGHLVLCVALSYNANVNLAANQQLY